jgi:hypothetical protein
MYKCKRPETQPKMHMDSVSSADKQQKETKKTKEYEQIREHVLKGEKPVTKPRFF